MTFLYYQIFVVYFIIFEMIKAAKKCYQFASIRDKIKMQRQTRLAKGVDAKNLTTKSHDDLAKIRNIGIIAHIDAGKTTTTQRMLYYAGALPSPGNIDDGTTTMDFLAQQRQRGITIRSAAISFNWSAHQINLIDTPGHVDFSGEVTRSLRVLDGVITILDAVKGVQAQTQKVWAQATKHKIAKICFLNKMDRIGSSSAQSIESLQKKLGIQPLVLQAPLGDGDSFRGVLDLIEMEQISFSGKYGEEIKKKKLEKNTQKHTYCLKLRQKLVQSVGNYHDEIAQMYLKQQFVPSFKLRSAIRKVITNPMHSLKVSPVLMGASFRNIGVQPLLDAIVSLLPSPSERDPIVSLEAETIKRQPTRKDPFVGYVFKVMFDIEKGPLAYTRIYSGHIKNSFDLYNSSKKLIERASQVLRVRANHYVPIQQISAGDIVALSGLKQTLAGDTLTSNASDEFLLQNLQVPNPVFTAPFQLQNAKYKRDFDDAMKRSVIQDTSLSYQYQSDTNQYLVNGLGQLHLEILKDRLLSDGIPVKMGSLKINFKQTINFQSKESLQIKKQLKPTVFEQFNLTVALVPFRTFDGKIQSRNDVVFTFDRVQQFDSCWSEFNKKKIISKNKGQKLNYSKQEMSKLRRNVRNPTPIQPIYEDDSAYGDENGEYQDQGQIDEDSEDEENRNEQKKKQKEEEHYFHINTLPFQTLYQLVEICKTSMLYGKNKLPAVGIQLQIKDGKYKRSSFSKSVMNRCASSLIRSVLDKSTVLIEPIMEFTLEGDPAMIQVALKDILKKRGRVSEQSESRLTGFVPAEGIRGWVSYLRSMGLEIQFKFSEYQQVVGVNINKLLEDNEDR